MPCATLSGAARDVPSLFEFIAHIVAQADFIPPASLKLACGVSSRNLRCMRCLLLVSSLCCRATSRASLTSPRPEAGTCDQRIGDQSSHPRHRKQNTGWISHAPDSYCTLTRTQHDAGASEKKQKKSMQGRKQECARGHILRGRAVFGAPLAPEGL